MGVLFPNNISKLLDGPVRALWAPESAAVPTNIADIISMVTPYTPTADWEDFGATTDAAGYDRDMDSEEYTIEQETGAVHSRITGVNRSFTLPLAEITPEHMQMIEEGGDIAAIAAAANKGAQRKAPFGGVESLTTRRVAFIAMRDPGFGDKVTEPGGEVRGPFVALVGYRAKLSAEGSGIEIAKGQLVSREVSFTLFPDSSVSQSDENTGAFFFEDAGTIAGA